MNLSLHQFQTWRDCNRSSVVACSHAVPVTVENPLATVTLSSLLELVAALMGCSDLPLDTQSNCGMMLVLLVVVLDSTGGEWFKVSFSSQVNSTNSIEWSISWGANINSGSQEILDFLWDLKIHCCVHKRPLDVPLGRGIQSKSSCPTSFIAILFVPVNIVKVKGPCPFWHIKMYWNLIKFGYMEKAGLIIPHSNV